jgi:hypothetical protein
LIEGVDSSGRDAAESAHGSGPDIAGAFVERQREHRTMREALRGCEHLPFTTVEKGDAVFRGCPDAVAVH